MKRLWRRQHDPVIIERTIGLGLGPFTALFRSVFMRCTLTNKAVGTIWRALSKPPQRRQGPDPRLVWLFVGTPSAFGLWLAYRLRVAQPSLMHVPIYFWYSMILLYICLCTTFLWPLRFGWLLVLSLCKEDYLHIFKCVSFWLHGCCGYWEAWALVNRFNYTNCVDVVLPLQLTVLSRYRNCRIIECAFLFSISIFATYFDLNLF